jgi:hypothetical protein
MLVLYLADEVILYVGLGLSHGPEKGAKREAASNIGSVCRQAAAHRLERNQDGRYGGILFGDAIDFCPPSLEETVRFMAFRSHWRFAAEFCTPGEVIASAAV